MKDSVNRIAPFIFFDKGNFFITLYTKKRSEEDFKFVRECAMNCHVKDVAFDDSGWHFTENL